MVVSSRRLRIKLRHLNNSISNPPAPNTAGAEVMTFSDRAVCWSGLLENCVYVCGGILQAGRKSWKQKLANITKEQKPHLTTKVFLVENVHSCLLLGRTQKVPSYGWIRTSSPQPPSQAHQPKAAGAMEKAQAWEKDLGLSFTSASANYLCDLGWVTNSQGFISLSLNKGNEQVSRSFKVINLFK